jgi:hypothetical protein
MTTKNMKEALSSTRKADTTHVRSGIRRYIARACEYGAAKYERSNYLRPIGDGTPRENFERLRTYLRAAQDHIGDMLDAMETHQAGDPELVDVEGMQRAAYAEDTDRKGEYPASGLPHIAHGCASLQMAIEQAIRCGLLPADPGQPWAAAQIEAPAPFEDLDDDDFTEFTAETPGGWRCTACDGITRGITRPYACAHCGREDGTHEDS